MELKLTVTEQQLDGPPPGSVGWLLANAAEVRLEILSGDPCASLYDRNGSLMVLLCGRNLRADEPDGDPAGDYSVTEHHDEFPGEDWGEDWGEDGQYLDGKNLSPEAWQVVRKIQGQAMTALQDWARRQGGPDPRDVDVVLVTVRDRDAAALADAAAAGDRSALPVLRDRLSEVI